MPVYYITPEFQTLVGTWTTAGPEFDSFMDSPEPALKQANLNYLEAFCLSAARKDFLANPTTDDKLTGLGIIVRTTLECLGIEGPDLVRFLRSF